VHPDPILEKIAGSFTAILSVLSMLIDQSPSKTLILERVSALAAHGEKNPDPAHPIQSAATAEQLRTVLAMLALDGSDEKKPAWKPEVIRGGIEDSEKPD
jgi:hypothetical protein